MESNRVVRLIKLQHVVCYLLEEYTFDSHRSYLHWYIREGNPWMFPCNFFADIRLSLISFIDLNPFELNKALTYLKPLLIQFVKNIFFFYTLYFFWTIYSETIFLINVFTVIKRAYYFCKKNCEGTIWYSGLVRLSYYV